MWKLEEKLPARGVKFYFIIKQDIPEKEHALWQEAVLRSSPLSQWFTRVQFEYSDHPTLIRDWQGWNLIKIFCPDAHISIKLSEAKSFYKEVFAQFSEWFIKLCLERRIECKPYDFRILFRLRPPEKPGEFVPIPSLNDISRKIVSPPNILPNPPLTPEAMFDLAQINTFSGKAFEEVLKYVEEKKWKLYGGYGIRTEKDANTYEFDTLPPDSSEEVESVQSLQGELSYELILYSKEKAPSDFNNAVKVLLARLQRYGVIDNEKVQHVFSNPDRYFEAAQLCSRFVLKFDVKEVGLSSERGKALDFVKKQLQKELADKEYHLYGVVSYTLTDEDLKRIEAVLDNIVYFRNTARDALYVRLYIHLVASDYERIIEIARGTDEILSSHKIIDLNGWPAIATDIEDAKKRWESAASDLAKDGRKAISYLFLREISAIPLQVFLDVRESVYKELNKSAEWASIVTIITSDNLQYSRYGCYVFGTRA
jgi:hypothetical protein